MLFFLVCSLRPQLSSSPPSAPTRTTFPFQLNTNSRSSLPTKRQPAPLSLSTTTVTAPPPFSAKLSLYTPASILPSPDLTPPACNHCEHHLQAFTLCQHNPRKRLSTHPISPSTQPRLINIQNQKPQPALPPTVTEKQH
jgi:hypothetical protein